DPIARRPATDDARLHARLVVPRRRRRSAAPPRELLRRRARAGVVLRTPARARTRPSIKLGGLVTPHSSVRRDRPSKQRAVAGTSADPENRPTASGNLTGRRGTPNHRDSFRLA